jgi:hypothetical protein
MTDQEYMRRIKRVLERTPESRRGAWVPQQLAGEMARRGHLPRLRTKGAGSRSQTPDEVSSDEDYIELVDAPPTRQSLSYAELERLFFAWNWRR